MLIYLEFLSHAVVIVDMIEQWLSVKEDEPKLNPVTQRDDKIVYLVFLCVVSGGSEEEEAQLQQRGSL